MLAWRRDRLLKGRIHLQSGRNLRWVFTQKDVMDFLIANFPDPDTDFGSPYHPRSSKAARIEKVLKIQRVLGRERRLALIGGHKTAGG